MRDTSNDGTEVGQKALVRRIIVSLLIFPLAACSATPSSQETMEKLNRHFSGDKTADFFLSYGNAGGKSLSKDGGITYRWVSLEPPETLPQPVYHSYAAPGGRHFAVPEAGSAVDMEPHYCELQIQADKKDIIRKLSIIRDSVGKRSNSLCSEIFE